ncbi:pre-RNA processing PIH1/Nop17-domain-containing protein [Halteromyces radiatus]|uniref:pre-RNA processing PIH1/Nop17-domain-containing protein n=1 Tax=Halteromyces radiatus TaxID=101107 RepID=UPI00221E46AE|nr:pre-RNA processing PIH1/Nop17-domain-containing protein [Halteromyces radiatus]KAI8079972.1 pre-RNA processing PIH1/Nop17-domain-containing protein [Halteromyces radiatus]
MFSSLTDTINLQPQVGYAFKTHITNILKKKTVENLVSVKYSIGTTIYINICHSDSLPAPMLATEADIQAALRADPGATYQVPLSLGTPRMTDDKNKAAPIMDACIHTQPFIRSEHDLDFRLYIMELAMEHVEDELGVNLSREFTMLKTPAKGLPIPNRIVHLPKKPGTIDHIVSTKLEKSKQRETSTLPQKPTVEEMKESWSCNPKFEREGNHLVVIIQMPLKSHMSWTVEIESSHLFLRGKNESKTVEIVLPAVINVESSSNQVYFYKKSGHLIVKLAVVDQRQRYL